MSSQNTLPHLFIGKMIFARFSLFQKKDSWAVTNYRIQFR